MKGSSNHVTPPATVDSRGTMPADLYGRLRGLPPTDPLNGVDTTGAATWSEATVSGLSYDGQTGLHYRRCHSIEHAAANPGKLLVVAFFPGFSAADTQNFTQDDLRRIANIKGATGRSALCVAMTSRGRQDVPGQCDHARDAIERYNMIRHAVTAVGESAVYAGGHCVVLVGVSTGVLDALQFAMHYPDEVGGIVALYGNVDLGLHPRDGYYYRQTNPATRAAIVAAVGDPTPRTEDALAPFIARDGCSRVAEIVKRGNIPVYVLGDWHEPVSITAPGRLIGETRADPETRHLVHEIMTDAGQSNRILHDSGFTNVSYHEQKWLPQLLGEGAGSAQAWTMPERDEVPVLGFMQMRAVADATNPSRNRQVTQIWMGSDATPAATGGRAHAAKVKYDMRTTVVEVTPYTSIAGYVEVLCDDERRIDTISQHVPRRFDLRLGVSYTEVEQAGFTIEFRADVGVTGSAPITAWAARIGGVTATCPAGKETAIATDAGGKTYVRAVAATQYDGDRMETNAPLWDPRGDFTLVVVFRKESSVTPQTLVAVDGHTSGKNNGSRYGASNVRDVGYYVNDSAQQIAGDLGGHDITLNAPHVGVYMRKGKKLHIRLDDGPWAETDIGTEVFTWGTCQTTLFAYWAQGAGVHANYWDGGIYDLAVAPNATGWATAEAVRLLMVSRWF